MHTDTHTPTHKYAFTSIDKFRAKTATKMDFPRRFQYKVEGIN